jgi:high affinity sulfate transporter 1
LSASRARKLPLLLSLQGYRSSWLSNDVVAGLTLVAIAVPEQMATARLANMPAITGLYAFVVGSVFIALFGASRQMSVGADSTIAPVVAAGVVVVAATGTPEYQHLVALMAITVGAILLLIGLLKLGWIADFISTPVVTGILAGIAVEILVRQLPSVLGVPGGGVSTIDRLRHVVHQLNQVNGWTLGLAAMVLGVILLSERIDRRVPGALLGLAASIAAGAALHLKRHGVRVLGAIPGGLPSIGLPSASFAHVVKLAAPALTVAFLCVVQSAATARSLRSGAGAGEALDHDLAGLGAANLVAGLVGAFPVNASPPRSAVVAASGGKSQVASLVAAAGTIAVVAFATGVLANLPQATLGAILIFVATRLLHVGDLRAIRRFDRVEFGLAMLTLAVVGFLGIEEGVVVALVLSLVDRTRLAARPRDTVLQREIGTDHWIPPDAPHPTERVPGVIVYLPLAPVWFGNAQYITDRIRKLVDDSPEPVRGLVFDTAGVSDIDFTGARALDELLKELRRRGITVGVARASGLVPRDLRRSDLLKDLGDHIYSDVESAVRDLTSPA